MKFLVVLLALVAFVAAEEEWKPIRTMEPYKLIHTDCATESGLTPEQAEKMAAFEYPDEEQVRKFILCGALKMGVFDGKGFSLDRVTQSFDVGSRESAKIEKVLNQCMEANVDNSTPEAWAYRGFLCMMNSDVGVALKKAMEANRQERAKNAAAAAASKAAASE